MGIEIGMVLENGLNILVKNVFLFTLLTFIKSNNNEYYKLSFSNITKRPAEKRLSWCNYRYTGDRPVGHLGLPSL